MAAASLPRGAVPSVAMLVRTTARAPAARPAVAHARPDARLDHAAQAVPAPRARDVRRHLHRPAAQRRELRDPRRPRRSSRRSSPATRRSSAPARATASCCRCSASTRCCCSTAREHLRQRKLLLPPFHGERMQRYREIMVEATEREIATWPPRRGRSRSRARMQEITLEVIMRAVFGVDRGARGRAPAPRAARHARVGHARPRGSSSSRADRPSASSGFGPFRRDDGAASTRALLAEIRPAPRPPTDLAEREDILSMLLQARDEDGEGLTDEELRDELMTLLVAGHETTATALGWAFERLLRHPEALGARDRGRRAAATARTSTRSRKETLRLRPVLPIVARRLQRAGDDRRRTTCPPGADVAPCIYLVHHREDVYPEPRRVPARALPRRQAGHVHVAAVRRRRAALHRRVVRAVRDAGRAGDVLRAVELAAPSTRRPSRRAADDHARPGRAAREAVVLARRMTASRRPASTTSSGPARRASRRSS